MVNITTSEVIKIVSSGQSLVKQYGYKKSDYKKSGFYTYMGIEETCYFVTMDVLFKLLNQTTKMKEDSITISNQDIFDNIIKYTEGVESNILVGYYISDDDIQKHFFAIAYEQLPQRTKHCYMG